MHPDQLAGRQNGARTRTNNTARELHVATSTHLTNTTPTRELIAEEMLWLPGNVEIGPGTGRRSLRKSAQLGAMQGVCKGRAAAYLLLSDADVKLGAVRKQGVWPPPLQAV